MQRGAVTLKDIYEVANRIEDRLEKIETRVSLLEIWKAEIMGKMAIVMAFLTISISMAWDFIKKKINI